MSVSVITACLNAEQTIGAMLDSVAAQGEALHELVVIDGGSTDKTREILASAQSRFAGRLRWVSEPDTGIYDALNKALAMVSGAWVLVLGADDTLEPRALKTIVEAAAANPDADLVYGDAYVRAADGRTHLQSSAHGARMGSGMPLEMPVCHQACAFSAAAYAAVGEFDVRHPIAADYDFYLRFRAAGLRSVRVPVPLATYSLAGTSSTLSFRTARDYRDVRIANGMSGFVANARYARSIINISVAKVLRLA